MAKRRTYKRDRKGQFAGSLGGSSSSGGGSAAYKKSLAATRAKIAAKKQDLSDNPLTPGAHMRAMNDPVRQASIKAAFNGMKMPTALPSKVAPVSNTRSDIRTRSDALKYLRSQPGAMKVSSPVRRKEAASVIKRNRAKLRAAKASGNAQEVRRAISNIKSEREMYKKGSLQLQNMHLINKVIAGIKIK